MNWSWVEPVIAILGLAVITVVSRSFFMIPEREMSMPSWLKRGLKYAPLAALTAVIAPEILMSQGQLINTFQDARLPAVLRRNRPWRSAPPRRRRSPCPPPRRRASP